MSGIVWLAGLMLGLGASIAAAQSSRDGACGAAATALAEAAVEVDAGEFEAASVRLRDAAPPGATPCDALTAAGWGWQAWLAADRASAAGGTPESLTAVREALAVLEPNGRALGPHSAYAAALAHAAAAAAQQERAEMRVWLEHAADLVRRLPSDERPWPLPPAVAEGELWIALHDYELAEAAFTRANAGGETALAWRGIGRARARRGDTAAACAPFARARDLAANRPSSALAEEAAAFLRLCR